MTKYFSFCIALLTVALIGCNNPSSTTGGETGATPTPAAVAYSPEQMTREHETLVAAWNSLGDIFEGDPIDIFDTLEQQVNEVGRDLSSMNPPAEAQDAYKKLMRLQEVVAERIATQKKLHGQQLDLAKVEQETPDKLEDEKAKLAQEMEEAQSKIDALSKEFGDLTTAEGDASSSEATPAAE
ncbi:MAG: hypothetical protein AB7S38_23820 [Vulcanimicrobiota bacterium]